MWRRLACVFLFFLFARGVAAQTVYEWWPELDIYWQPSARQRSMLELARKADQETTSDQGTVGIYQDYLALPNGGFLRGGYRFTFSATDASYRESRLVGEATLKTITAYDLRFANRNRLELRWVNGEYSYRIRDRIHLTHRAPAIRGQPTDAYGTFEAYYDSRYNTISRLAGRAGLQFPFARRRLLDVYLATQNNSRGSPPRVYALGMTLSLTY